MGIERSMFWFMDYPSLNSVQLFANSIMPRFRQARR